MKVKHLIIICIILLIAGILFWPTLYRYEKINIAGYSFPMKINRITGHAKIFYSGEWVSPLKNIKEIKNIMFPYEEIIKITGNAWISNGSFLGKIYNGSEWTIKEIIFRVELKEKDNSIRWNRKFKHVITVLPLSTSSFSFDIIGDKGYGSFELHIEEVWGRK